MGVAIHADRPVQGVDTSYSAIGSYPATPSGEIENAAHILVQAMLGPRAFSNASLPPSTRQYNQFNALLGNNRIPGRVPLAAIDRNRHPRSPNLAVEPPATPSNLDSQPGEKHCAPAEARSFPDQDSFEEWAIEKLLKSHAEVVVEKKRSSKTTTISCRNRRGEAAGGCSCSWVLKASMREEEGESTKWVVIRSELVHNTACIERMDRKLASRAEDLTETVVDLKLKAKPACEIQNSVKQPSVLRKTCLKRSLKQDVEMTENEAWHERRRRKSDHPGNALPSRALRYKY